MPARLIQLGGWALLIVYLAQTPIVFDPLWVAVYVAVSVGIGAVYVLAVKPLVHLMRGTGKTGDLAKRPHGLFPHPRNAPLLEGLFRKPLRSILLAPGETGLFFLPVALIGVAWWSVLLAAVLFGFAHYKTYSIEQCSLKAFIAFLNCYFILPYGVIHLVIGHLIVDAVAIGTFWMITSREDRLSANSTVETDARETSARGSP